MSDLLAPTTFADLAHLLDARVLRALADFKFLHPTLVQAKAIPLALAGKDILAKARTGSGKTGAYCIPVVQKVLSVKSSLELSDPDRQQTRALILVPTRELAEQVTRTLKGLVTYCDKEVLVANVAGGASAQLQRILLSDRPDVIVSTPSRALALLQAKTLALGALETLTIDEADLILSYGHSSDIAQIFSGGFLPKVYQSFLMSATMTKDVELLKGMVLRNPAILRLEEDPAAAASNLTQYYVRTSEKDKFLLAYVLLKLKLVRGKCLIFVADVDRSYRLKLFLEQFGVKACVLNSELPLNSRYHIVQEFNKGVYDYIIATDEGGAADGADEEDEEEAQEEQEGGAEVTEEIADETPQFLSTAHDSTPLPSEPSSSKRQLSPPPTAEAEASSSKPSKRARKNAGAKQDRESGVSRGVDFVSVACVLNFDLPTTTRAYTHRVGRTARAHQSGLAISFVVPAAEWGTDKVLSLPSAKRDEQIFERIKSETAGDVKEWDWGGRKAEVEGFRYRMEDALRSVTKKGIQEARREEVRRELLNSEKLKAHFALNPNDLNFLRHDGPLHPTRVQSHMKHVPGYLMPRISTLAGSAVSASAAASGVPEGASEPRQGADPLVPFNKPGRGRGRGRGGRGGGGSGRRSLGGPGGGAKKRDPLKTFKS